MERVTILVRGPFSERSWYQIPRHLFMSEEYALLPQLREKAYRCQYDTEWNYWIRRYDIINETIDLSIDAVSSHLDGAPESTARHQISSLETRLVASFFLDDVWERYRVSDMDVIPYAIITEYTAIRHKH